MPSTQRTGCLLSSHLGAQASGSGVQVPLPLVRFRSSTLIFTTFSL
ncbi:hypothetical protein OROHE_015128 [Orobanche hederae]